MKRIPASDREFEDSTITDVKNYPDDDFLDIGCDGTHIGCPKFKDGFTPKPGMTLRMYSKGFGYAVRGIVVDGHIAYYRTPAQQEVHHKKMVAKMNRESRERFAKARKSIEMDYKSLPPVLRARIDRLRKKSPRDRHSWEPYEMFVLKEAAKIIDVLKTPEKVKEASDNHYSKAWSMVPTLDKSHSGNTFGCAFQLAYRVLAGGEV